MTLTLCTAIPIAMWLMRSPRPSWEGKRHIQGEEQSLVPRSPNSKFGFPSILPLRRIRLGKESKRRWNAVILIINTIVHFLQARSHDCIFPVLKPSLGFLYLLPSSNLEGIYLISYNSSHKPKTPKTKKHKTAWQFIYIPYRFMPLGLYLQFLV